MNKVGITPIPSGRNFAVILVVTCLELANSLVEITRLINSQRFVTIWVHQRAFATCLYDKEELISLNQIEPSCSVILEFIRLCIIHIH